MLECDGERFVSINGFDNFVSDGSQMTCNHCSRARFIVSHEYTCFTQIDHVVRLPGVVGPIWAVLPCYGQAGMQSFLLKLVEPWTRRARLAAREAVRLAAWLRAALTQVEAGRRNKLRFAASKETHYWPYRRQRRSFRDELRTNPPPLGTRSPVGRRRRCR